MKYLLLISLLTLILSSSAIEIQIDQENEINEDSTLFQLDYTKETEKSIVFFLFYYDIGRCDIELTNPSKEISNFSVDSDSEYDYGIIPFPYVENGLYAIEFICDNVEPEKLKETIPKIFKVVSSEHPFTLDINRRVAIGFNYESDLEGCDIYFTFTNFINDTYIKQIQDFKDEDDYRFISEDDGEYKLIRRGLLFFKKGVKYTIKLEVYRPIDGNVDIRPFILDEILDKDSVRLETDFLGRIKFNEDLKCLMKVNVSESDYYVIDFGSDSYFELMAFENEDEFNLFPYNFQYLELKHEDCRTITKKDDKKYYLIYIESELLTELFFTREKLIELNKEIEISEQNFLFKLNYEKKSEENEMLYLLYEREKDAIAVVCINSEFNCDYIEGQKGTITRVVKSNEERFNFIFYFVEEFALNFRIVSSEYEFTLEGNKELVFNRIESKEEFNSHVKFNFTNTEKNFYKFFSTNDTLENIVLCGKGQEKNHLKNHILLLKKGETVSLDIDTAKISGPIKILNLDETSITDLTETSYEIKEPTIKIFKIDYFKTPYFELDGDDSNKYFIADITEHQFKNLPKDIENLSFKLLTDKTLAKPDNVYYSILIADLTNSTLTVNKKDNPQNTLDYNSEQTFNSFKTDYKFEIPETKEDKLLLIYKTNEDFNLIIDYPDGDKQNEELKKKDWTKSLDLKKYEKGAYNIKFSSDKKFEGKFKVVKISEEFNMNINDKINLNSFTTDFKPQPLVIVFTFDNSTTDKDEIYKKLTFGNSTLLNLVQIGEGEHTFKNLNLDVYAFEKDKEYRLKIDFEEEAENQYKFNTFSIDAFDKYDYQNLTYGNQTFESNDEYNYKFFTIDFNTIPKLKINKIKENNAIMKIAYHNNDVDFKTILNDLTYYDLNQFLDDKNILVPNSSQRATLLIQLDQGETIIEFINGKKSDDEDDDDDDDNNLALILSIAIPAAVILIVVILILVCRCKRKQTEIEITDKTKNDELMPLEE